MMEYICTQEEESREDTTTCTTTTFEEAADGKLNLSLNCTTHFFISHNTIYLGISRMKGILIIKILYLVRYQN